MIRRVAILALVAAAAGATVLWIASLQAPLHWVCFTSQRRHMCVEIDKGNCFFHYVYSDQQRFINSVDNHEAAYPRHFLPTMVSYGEGEHGYYPGETPPPTRTYAWSHRFGFPLIVMIALLVSWPAVAFVRRHSHRRVLGFDPRITSTTTRMLVATLIGTVMIPIGYLPGSHFGLYWLRGVQGVPMWVVMPIVVVVSFSPVLWCAVWSFWRLTPGDHGGMFWRRRQRLLRQRGLCLTCGYDLTGNDSGACPECGRPTESTV